MELPSLIKAPGAEGNSFPPLEHVGKLTTTPVSLRHALAAHVMGEDGSLGNRFSKEQKRSPAETFELLCRGSLSHPHTSVRPAKDGCEGSSLALQT